MDHSYLVDVPAEAEPWTDATNIDIIFQVDKPLSFDCSYIFDTGLDFDQNGEGQIS